MDSNALPARIAGELAELIALGEIDAETHLNTQDFAVRFSVSRTPVREALNILCVQGLVEQRPNRGYFVRPLSPRAKSQAAKGATSSSAPSAYHQLAEDWLRDEIPSEVGENYLRQRYRLTKAQVTAILTRGAAEGWIERKAGYGWRLLPVAKTAEAQEQLYRMRLLLEPAGLLEPTFAFDRPVAERLRDTLQAVLDHGSQAWPADKLHAVGVEFHEELMRMSGNPFMLQALVRVNRLRRLLEYRSMVERARVVEETHEHLEILDPLFRGDITETSFLMRRHVGKALQRKRPAQHLLSQRIYHQ